MSEDEEKRVEPPRDSVEESGLPRTEALADPPHCDLATSPFAATELYESSRDAGGEVTDLLDALVEGDQQAGAELLPLVYRELRQLAQVNLKDLPPGQTLQATALVHEAYMRMIEHRASSAEKGWEGRAHFFAAAAQAMRHILVEQARRKSRIKHGGGRARVEVNDAFIGASDETPLICLEKAEEILAVDEAFDRLRSEHPRKGEVVMLHYFAGLTHAQIADLLRITTRTVERDWRFARAWLREALGEREHQPSGDPA